jgi:hypothetical protein
MRSNLYPGDAQQLVADRVTARTMDLVTSEMRSTARTCTWRYGLMNDASSTADVNLGRMKYLTQNHWMRLRYFYLFYKDTKLGPSHPMGLGWYSKRR